ncbi:MAG: class II aldolase/adducin family protein [Candidatus Heimdallarchaeota archaeon]|nr:class II aldolase/adducin family protein [Candidatus Heimdallarchaeota archaeon]
MSIEETKEAVAEAGRRLIREGLVAGTWGNISIRVGDVMVITPSGVDYETATADDMVVVNIETMEYKHTLKPSSEKKLHAEIYKTRKDINAVVHSHSMNASTVAAARREVPPILDDMAQIIGPSIRVAKYALPSTKKIVKETVKALKGRFAALMANHGAIAIGRDLDEAFTVAIIMEKACKAFIEAEFLGGAKEINKFEAHFMHQYYLRKYSKKKKE